MRKRTPLSKLIIFVVSLFILFFIAEWGYRLRIKKELAQLETIEFEKIDTSYRVCSKMHVAFDEKYGEHPRPDDSCFFIAVTDGEVVGGTEVFKSNKDGLDGKTTLDEYKKADIKILIFGDSFVHWNQKGETWPDILQEKLNLNSKKSIAILNYGRGGYGFLQMLDLAADKIDELHPDLVMFGITPNSLENARWWSNAVKEDGYTRWIVSSKKDNFTNIGNTCDMAQVTEGTTPEWCRKQLANPDTSDPILKKANAQCLAMARQIAKEQYDVPLFSWNHSYLLAKILKGSAVTARGPFFASIKFDDYAKDAKAVEDANRIKASKTKLVLAFMPNMNQIKYADKDLLRPKTHILMKSAEKLLNTQFFFLQKGYTCKLPAVIDLKPLDGHPNYDGLKFYAEALAPMVRSKIYVKPLMANNLPGY